MSTKELIERARRAAAEIRKFELVAEPLPTIRTSNPAATLARLAKGDSVAVLSPIDRRSRMGKRQFLVGEPEGENSHVFAVVVTEKALRFECVDDIPSDVCDTLDATVLSAHADSSPVYVVPLTLVAGFNESVALRRNLTDTTFGPAIDIAKAALAKGEVVATTGTTNDHKHQAIFDSETGDGQTGAPTDNKQGHTHLIQAFKVQAGDEGHTHTLPRSQKKDASSTAPVAAARQDVRKFYTDLLTQDQLVKVIFKRDVLEERFVLGVVLEPETIDSQGHVYSAEEVRKAAHNFLEIHARMGLMHKQDVTGKIKILESFVAPADIFIDNVTVKKGTWLLGARIVDNELWEGVKNGDFNGWSIGGTAIESVEEMDQMLATLTV